MWTEEPNKQVHDTPAGIIPYLHRGTPQWPVQHAGSWTPQQPCSISLPAALIQLCQCPWSPHTQPGNAPALQETKTQRRANQRWDDIGKWLQGQPGLRSTEPPWPLRAPTPLNPGSPCSQTVTSLHCLCRSCVKLQRDGKISAGIRSSLVINWWIKVTD